MFYGKEVGLLGFKVMVWGVMGWGVDGSVGVVNDLSKLSIYWSNGVLV